MKRLRTLELSSYSEVAGTTPRDLGRTGVASTGPAAPKRTRDAPELCYRITDSRTFGHFSGRRFFLLLKTPPSPIRSRVSKLPLRRSPGAEFPMAAQVHGCFRRAPRGSPPHECHSCCALQVRGCVGPAEPERRGLCQKPPPLSRHAADDVCLRFRYARRTMTHNLPLRVRPCRQLRSVE